MKLSNKQIQQILAGTNAISEGVKNLRFKLEIGTSFQLAVMKKTIAPAVEAFQEASEELLDRYVLKDADGQKKKLPEVKDQFGNVTRQEQWDLGDRLEEWKKEQKALLEQEVDFDRLKPIKFQDFKLKKVAGAKAGEMEDGDIDPEILFLLTPWLELE